MVDQKYLEKAEVLIEALPYIRRLHDKIIVVKYGGSAMIDEELKREVIQDVVLLKLVGFRPIIVHADGAGKGQQGSGGQRTDSGCAGCRDQRHGWRYAEGRKEICGWS